MKSIRTRIIMRLLAALGLSALIACAAHPYARTSGARAYLNEPVGFRDLGWGTDLKRVSGMKLVSRTDAEAPEDRFIFYERRNEDLSVGHIPLYGIVYSAFEDGGAHRLVKVSLMAKDWGSCLDLAQAAVMKYGNPHEEYRVRDVREREWTGSRTVVNSRCDPRFNDYRTGGISFESMKHRLELLRRMRIYDEKKLREAGDDL